MSDISFFHIASIYPTATARVVGNIRNFHPNEFYFLGVDGSNSYSYLSEQFNLHYRAYTKRVGGPVGDYGYRLDGTLEFLNRFHTACINSNSSHIMMVEDDVWLVKPVTVNPEWEMACHNISVGNEIPLVVRDKIKEFSGKEMSFIRYGGGGGSIFKVSTFIENYDRIVPWFKDNFDAIQYYYPTIGYIDCFMNMYYYLCGKDYTINPHLTDTHNHKPGFDYEQFIGNLSPEIEIVNNYKKYYYE